MKGRVLVIDDDPAMCESLADGLSRRGFEVASQSSAVAALDDISANSYDAVVSDLRLRGMQGLELCERVVANRPHLPVILITAFGSLDTAIAAIRAGAYDFITKPFEIDALTIALERAIEHHALKDEVTRLREEVAKSVRFDRLIGSSPPMQRMFAMLRRVAESDASVLIVGETGTGKELVARSLHERGKRADAPFIGLNCAAMPDTLLESELFGHAKGAFTDAKTEHRGLFVRASGGTLFLDEIADMPLGLQPKLLRALQERRVRPIGESREIAFDARLIAATNRDLEDRVEEGSFRHDLYFRLNVITVKVPPLRERGGDILLLAQHFLQGAATGADRRVVGMSGEVAARLMRYDWPGNVRELQNCMEHGVALARSQELTVEDLPERLRTYSSWHGLPTDPSDELVPLAEVERRYILHVLGRLGGNKRRAAAALGLDRTTLYRKLARYGIGEADD